MLGAIAGDIIGSAWERTGEKRLDFPLFTASSRFTDDTVMTVAIAHALLDERDYADAMREYGGRYPYAGYRLRFARWIRDPTIGPYGSFGNGAAMRVAPVAYAVQSIEQLLAEATRSAAPTHNTPEGTTGAQATALAVFLARIGEDKETIRGQISRRFGYDLSRSVAQIRPSYKLDMRAERSVPESILSFLEADSFEGAVRNAVSLGGDTDTMACIAGAIAEAYFGAVPEAIVDEVERRLPAEFLRVIERFSERYGINS
jgi:ADP-ribosylglycohydrolase